MKMTSTSDRLPCGNFDFPKFFANRLIRGSRVSQHAEGKQRCNGPEQCEWTNANRRDLTFRVRVL